jgi:hypothetical protein
VGKALDAHLRVTRGLCRSSEAHEDCSNGGGGRSEEPVNSKNPTLPL